LLLTITIGTLDKRVDLNHCGVALRKQIVDSLHLCGGLLDAIACKVQLLGQVLELILLRAFVDIDWNLEMPEEGSECASRAAERERGVVQTL
jgi:hypothetical protein